MSIKNYFLPHPQTHQKAHLVSIEALAIYLAIFIVLQMSFGVLKFFKPDILGVSSSINVSEVIRLTNEERVKGGLSPVTEDPRLDKAAQEKAKNMYEENYWAHFSPSGKDPWGFIRGSGYNFTYAGENLARNFQKPEEVIRAWMASPTHKDNMLNPNYQHIGVAVTEGTLKGEPTILIVQEFGSQVEAVAQGPNGQVQSINSEMVSVAVAAEKITIDPYQGYRQIALGGILLLAVLLMIDMYVLRRRAVIRVSSRHLAHLGVLGVAASAVMNITRGSIL